MTLFANGLCNYELSSKVVGDATLSLTVESEDMSKLLSSLTVVDLSGRGMVSSISYESPGYDETVRKEVGAGLGSTSHVFSTLVKDAIGTRVAVETRSGSSRKSALEGILLGVENDVGKDVGTMCLILLIEGFEVRCVDVPDVKNVRFHNSEIQRQFAMFTGWKSRRHVKTKKKVVIKAKGEGVRSISANFLASMPAWKTSYRFLISPHSLLIQGWAVIDNITDQDLEGVELTLVSEIPMPLGRDLYHPQGQGPSSGEQENISQMRRRLTGAGGDTDEEGEKDKGDAAKKSPLTANGGDNAADDDFRSSASVASAHTQNYEHKIANSVSIRRFQSALVPVIFSECYGGRVGLYNSQNCPDRVLSAVQILNSTKSVLEAGPVTIFDDGAYVGEAVLPRCLPDQMNFLPYSTDKAFVAKDPEILQTNKFVDVKVVNDQLVLSRGISRTSKYHFTNLRSFEADLHVEHCMKNEDCSVTSCRINDSKNIEPRTVKGKVVQYVVHFNPEEVIDMVIHEESKEGVESSSSTFGASLSEVTEDDIKMLATNGKINESQASSLRGMIAFNQRKVAVETKLSRLEADKTRLDEREKKTRENLEALKDLDKAIAGEATVRYLSKLDSIDDEREKAHGEIRTFQDEVDRISSELSEALKSFSI